MLSTQGELVKILDFKYFTRFYSFSGTSKIDQEKKIISEINVSVVLDIVCGDT